MPNQFGCTVPSPTKQQSTAVRPTAAFALLFGCFPDVFLACLCWLEEGSVVLRHFSCGGGSVVGAQHTSQSPAFGV